MKYQDPWEISGAVIGMLLILILMPFAYIWAWNTLFGSFLTIEYTFWNWLATFTLVGIFTYRKVKS